MPGKVKRIASLDKDKIFIIRETRSDSAVFQNPSSLRDRALKMEETIITRRELQLLKEDMKKLKIENMRLKKSSTDQFMEKADSGEEAQPIQYREFTERLLQADGQPGNEYRGFS